jgi:hypothetical protein
MRTGFLPFIQTLMTFVLILYSNSLVKFFDSFVLSCPA